MHRGDPSGGSKTAMLLRQQVGRFEIRDFLGRGAIGDVMLAWDPESQAEVALKVVRLRQADPEMLEAEKNGVSLQQQLSRAAPQVAAVHEWGEDGDFFWVCMEYVAGSDLSAVLSRGALPEDRAINIARQLCQMLEVCHEFSAEVGGRKVFGVIHGDIKPENIRVQEGDDGERVRVLDFGIAKHLSQTRRFTVNLFGSLPYTPPERLERGTVDRHSDLWALGIVLYIMVSGNRPFPGDTTEELDRRIRRGDPPNPLPSSVSPRLAGIIEKSLAFEVERRYPTASAFRADLEALRDGQPLPSQSAPGRAADLSATRRTDRAIRAEGREERSEGGDEGPLDATRRTDRPDRRQDLDSTRRTSGPAPMPALGSPGFAPSQPTAPIPGPLASSGAGPSLPPLPPLPPSAPNPAGTAAGQAAAPPAAVPTPGLHPSQLGRRIGIAVLLLLIAFGAMGHVWVRGEAREIQRILASQSRPDLEAVLAQYQNASRLGLLGGSELTAAGAELREALIKAADARIDSYRGDSPATTERGWRQAQSYLQAALEIERDRRTRARMIYAQAQLDRIEAQSLKQKGQVTAGNEKCNEAIRGFREAARRDPEWPDPFLGLARIYAYQRFDLQELEEAVRELAQRGYRLGQREKAMLADGHRMRGRELWSRSLQVRRQGGDEDEEKKVLDQANDHLETALAFYGEIPRYADVPTNRAAAEGLLAQVDARAAELDSGGFEIDIPFFDSEDE